MNQGVIPQQFNVDEILVKKIDDKEKDGTTHSRIFQNYFEIDGWTSGISPNVTRLIFEKKVEIVGILVSVDHTNGNMSLAEFEARINAINSGYGYGENRNALIHTSFAGDRITNYGKTDEHIWFGKNSGIEVAADNWISFGAWLANEELNKSGLSPEFIVWYRWLE